MKKDFLVLLVSVFSRSDVAQHTLDALFIYKSGVPQWGGIFGRKKRYRKDFCISFCLNLSRDAGSTSLYSLNPPLRQQYNPFVHESCVLQWMLRSTKSLL
uniref:Secreted protein n=1 Tax=Pyxicephalus adspersus TaxID=30357 RepID=A0AAV2ZSQ6_PYXAD|nr:TPA: hypothetical protein GDO54_002471 [Pyxicephalus adspersus]